MEYHYDTPSGGQFFADAYSQCYKLDLWSNFTFFLDNPVNGDGINQHDQRYIYGGNLGYRQAGDLLGIPSSATAGFQVRNDSISNIRLGTQTKRTSTGTIVESAVEEASYSPYVKLELQPTPWMRLSGGVRADYFTFDVRNLCDTCSQQPAGRKDSGQVNPKGNLILGPWFNMEFFVNYGTGFHSNDARATVAGDSSPLARAQGVEVGLRSKPWGPDRIELLATLWGLDLQSELLFVGDAGTTEVRGPTRRYGVEVGARGQIYGPLYINGSFTWTHAEFKNTGGAIPLAPDLTAFSAVILRWPEGLSSQLQMTYLGVRPLTEDRTVKAPSWLIFDLTERYQLPIKLTHFCSSRTSSMHNGSRRRLPSPLACSTNRPAGFKTSISCRVIHAFLWAASRGTSSRPLKTTSNCVLVSKASSTYPRGYASGAFFACGLVGRSF
jgi:hypothetical protein